MSMQASTPEMLGNMTSSLEVIPRTARAESRIFMNMTNSALKEALRRNCTRVQVEIVFPYGLREYTSIEIRSSHKGNVRVRMDDIYLTNKLTITTNKGSVDIRDTTVEQELKVQASGSLRADVEVENLVNLGSSGPLRLNLASWSSNLNVNARSNDEAVVSLVIFLFLLVEWSVFFPLR